MHGFFSGDSYVLIDWVGEDAHSVVKSNRVNGGVYEVGKVERVRFGPGYYDGRVVAAGKSVNSTCKHSHIHGYMDFQALKMQWKLC